MISAESPFGVALYPLFEAAYAFAIRRPASSFAFHNAPLSTWSEVAVTVITYLLVIFGGQYLMRGIPAMKLARLSQIHNALLSVGSLALLLLMAEQIIPMLINHGIWYAICDPSAWTQKLELLYYINYLFKYWELIDTVFLVLKKKPLEFLHFYHHAMTLVLCFTQLLGLPAVAWIPIGLNLTVHVAMYYYYFLASCGIRVWWKQYLTTMQITQFVLDLIAVYFCTYQYTAATYVPWLPHYGTCTGSEMVAFFGVISLTSYLVLFISFYIKTYRSKGRALGGGAKPDKATNGHVTEKISRTNGKANGKANGSGSGNGKAS